MKIAVVGTGYVGLVTGAGFSDFGHDVTCVDIDARRVETLRRGDVPFYEPGLHDLIKRNADLGRLTFTTSTAEAVAGAEIVFIAVGTPSADDGSADLSYVLDAAKQIGAALTGFTVDRHQEHRPGRHRREGARRRGVDREAPVRRRLEPRVPQGGRRGQRLPQARARDRRRRRSARPSSCCASSTAAFCAPAIASR